MLKQKTKNRLHGISKKACDDNNTAAPSKILIINYIRNHGIATNYIICNN
jgi:hypothetical protein